MKHVDTLAPWPRHVTEATFGARGSALVGRRRELERLDRIIASVRGGESRALVIRAEAGLGKTVLLDYLVEQATDCRVLRANGVESEMELPLAAIQQLCAPILDGIDSLPEPQALALGVALGLRSGPAPDQLVLGLAVLSLVSHAACTQPLVCVVDDAQWLDQASAKVLAFVARRLVAESVALVFAVREDGGERFAAIDDMVVSPLHDADARTLLGAVIRGPIDAAVRERIVAEAHGNPLALVELQRVNGEFAAATPAPNGSTWVLTKLEDAYRRRIEQLPPEARRLLLVAAIEPVGDPTLVLAAASSFGLDASAFAPAIEDDLLEFGGRLRFRHPLVRSAVIASETATDRRAAHRAIARATDIEQDPDRRAWHFAEGTIGFDEDVAAALVLSADRARQRGGFSAAANFHARGAELTPDRRMRSLRTLMAAEDKVRAGSAHEALRMITRVEPNLLDDHQRARLNLVLGHASFYVHGGRGVRGLLEAAQRLEPYDGDAAVATYSDTFIRALLAGSRAGDTGVEAVAKAILTADPSELGARASAALNALRGLAVLTLDGYAAAVPSLKAALTELRSEHAKSGGGRGADPRRGLGADVSDGHAMAWMPLTCLVARVLLDDVALLETSAEFVRACLRDGVLSKLAMATAEHFPILLMSGRIADAEELRESVREIMAATDVPAHPDRDSWFAAFRGDDDTMRRSTVAVEARVAARHEGQWQLISLTLSGTLLNSSGRYSEALASTSSADGHPFDIGLAGWLLPEHIEAAVRSGAPEQGRVALDRLNGIARATGTDLAIGLAARSAALLADDRDAEPLYRAAIDALGRTKVGTAEARAHLLYGEWLRRQNRRVDARASLRIAHELFDGYGAHAFADRAARELAVTGEIVRRSKVDPVDDLTAQERQIARLAATGSTNPEIGAQLFLSPRTVEWHLRKVFGKLGVTSRRQLTMALQVAPGA